MKLFHVQDSDRPMYIASTNWMHALERWRNVIVKENPGVDRDDCEPDGISLIAEDNDFFGLI